MDISTSAAIDSVLAAKQSATKSQIAYALAAKSLESQRAQGDAALELIESAGQIGKAEGKGHHFDAAR